MAMDVFLKLGSKIKGESQDEALKDTIVIESFNWGVSQSGNFSSASGTGGGSGRCTPHDLGLTKSICMASPDIFQQCASGEPIPEATLYVRRAGGEAVLYYQLDMKNVIVSSYSSGGGGGSGDNIHESFSLNCEELKEYYWKQNPDGTQGTGQDKAFNFSKNKKV